VLDRLDRLTDEESKMTVAQTYDVVCGLLNKMQVVMEGTHLKYVIRISTSMVRKINLVGNSKASTVDM
jgi:hypothetical protein